MPLKQFGRMEVEKLLDAAWPLKIAQMRKKLRSLGYLVDGAQFRTITTDLIEFTGSPEGAMQAAMELWLHVVDPEDVREMMAIAKRGKCLANRSRTPATARFFKNGTDLSFLGNWVVSHLKQLEGIERFTRLDPKSQPSAEEALIEELLRAISAISVEEKRAALHKAGLVAPRNDKARYDHRLLTCELIVGAGSIKAAQKAAMDLWSAHATTDERAILDRASSDRRGPRRAEQPTSMQCFFNRDGTPSRLGRFALDVLFSNQLALWRMVSRLLGSVPLTITKLRTVLRELGYRSDLKPAPEQDGADYLIEITGSHEDALDAAMKVWIHVARPEDVKAMIRAAKSGKGPSREERSPAIAKFFKANTDGDPTVLGDWVLDYFRRKDLGTSAHKKNSGSGASALRLKQKGKNLRTKKDTTETKSFKVQGGPKHRQIQECLGCLGEMMNFIVRTDHPIGAGFQPDVLWYKLDPDDQEFQSAAHVIFEIESVAAAAALSKSLASLLHAHHRWRSHLFLIAPKHRLAAIEDRVGGPLGGAFHEIKDDVRFISIEECPTDIHELWKLIMSMIRSPVRNQKSHS